ncbi:MAG: LytS/YhcK type 5TM receptor domain-containing protein [Oryzomonas sp.]|uniref:LytS/YhcK type 5TM receptor domain-containing protein n=1 Tax=Oryzomonas sp. TaxID=2855186 RepID=UPI00283CADCC|nr:LytS/YhcK type 5TM receptor domain-containing protein [Oryzomonas sp.]MDR3579246.1 LytS/YhcK type 5TM receptor domain-containing protein [Oryzomonas sp.]
MNETIRLSLDLFERLGILAVLFFLMLRFELFRRFLTGKVTTASNREKLFHAVYFGLAGIFATYCGFPVHGAIANLRTVPVVLGGILGGPLVGLSAGIIAGVHRYYYDVYGVTSLACAIATPLAGVAAGLIYHRLHRKAFDPILAFFIGIVAESIKMGLILLLTWPDAAVLDVVHAIGLPSVLANAFGVAVLVEVIASVAREQERAVAQQAQTTLNIAFRTLPYLRQGLNRASAEEAVHIIREMTGLDAVCLSNENEILAHEGLDGEQHAPGGQTLTFAARRALETSTVVIAPTKSDIGWGEQGCRLGSAVIVPLKIWGKTVGVMELYRLKEHAISRLDAELANGLAHLFSNQLELGEIEFQRKLVAEAEIKALQAQINPHFLFNAISTIISYTRTNPQTASCLLVKLAEFFRKNISPAASKVPLSVELEHCEAYIAIEMARFEERLSIVYEIEDAALSCNVPSLILQPLVENSVRHGILPKEGGGVIHIGAQKDGNNLIIYVKDNGVGMSRERIQSFLSETVAPHMGTGLGLALRNVNSRLATLYGNDKGLKIESEPGEGTTVRFCVPVGV